MNLGVLAPALSEMWPRHAGAVWAGCLLAASTRIFLLAHWASDVATGFSLGAAIEGVLRPITGASPAHSTERECDVAGDED